MNCLQLVILDFACSIGSSTANFRGSLAPLLLLPFPRFISIHNECEVGIPAIPPYMLLLSILATSPIDRHSRPLTEACVLLLLISLTIHHLV